jgi:hypothetical protein
MIEQIVVAIVIAALIGLLLVGLLGPILVSVGIPIVVVLGNFFVKWGWVLGVLFGLLVFFGGWSFFGFGGHRG